jgi:hypothetical protein
MVKTEVSKKDELFKINKFFIEGDGNIKYTHNNGNMASDPKLAVNYFLSALDKIPSLIEKYQKETEKLSKDLVVLQEVVGTTWRKENELKDLKTELAALDRKIQLSLTPVDQSEGEIDKSDVQENQNDVSGKIIRHDFTKHDNTNHNTGIANASIVSNAPNDHCTNPIDPLHDLLSGKITPADYFKTTLPENHTINRLQQAKEEMGDRLVIASLPKHNIENKPKGIKL